MLRVPTARGETATTGRLARRAPRPRTSPPARARPSEDATSPGLELQARHHICLLQRLEVLRLNDERTLATQHWQIPFVPELALQEHRKD
jgi:hypothetical protein